MTATKCQTSLLISIIHLLLPAEKPDEHDEFEKSFQNIHSRSDNIQIQHPFKLLSYFSIASQNIK